MVTGTPSIETVMFGDPALALARMVRAVEVGMVSVADALPPLTMVSADCPEALRSETTRTELADDRVIFSASTAGVIVPAAVAVATGTGTVGGAGTVFGAV